MNTLKKITLLALSMCAFGVFAQEAQHPFWTGTAETVTIMPSLASKSTLAPAIEKKGPVLDGRASKYIIVPGKGSTGPDQLAQNKHRLEGAIPGKMPSLVFETALSNSQPTDPAGAVGPDHYFAVFNTGFRVFAKDGTPLTGQLATSNIFPANGCCDLTVSYDNLADRWVVSFLGNGVQVAVSNGPDPVNDTWTVYNFPNISDYNKLSVWRDGYYITENTGGSNKLWVLERNFDNAGIPDPAAQMAGFSLPGIVTSGFHSPQALNITNDDHPSSGGCPIIYLQDDAWAGVDAGNDHVKLWEANMDWDDINNSEVTAPIEIPLTPFISVFDNGSFVNLAQPNGGTSVDALQATIMNQAQFRSFATHNAAIFNFVVDTDDTNGELAGIRWVEFRQDDEGQPWTLYQEGTYTAPDGKHAWHGSMAMDSQGNIGLGYTAMAGPDTPTDGSVDEVLSSYYTGRFAADPLGTMSIDETVIAIGSGNIPSTRYGDYGKLDVNPTNDKEFWFINEYVGPSGRANVVGVFQIASNFANDAGVVSIDEPISGSLTATEDVTITIFNFGENDISNFDVTYQIDGGAVVTETFTGTISSGTNAQYTFDATADLSTVGNTYEITAATALAGDEDNDNNSLTEAVVHLEPNDIGITDLLTPTSGTGLTDAEVVSVNITNFGGATQSDFEVSYSLDGGTPVTEIVPGPLEGNSTLAYSFAQTADVGTVGTYTFSITTSLAGDSDTTNDQFEATVVNQSCTPTSDCAGFNDGVTQLLLADQDINVNCGTDPAGYSDDTDIVFTFNLSDNPFEGTLQMGFDDSIFAIWIDFNDNGAFEADELIASEQVADAETDFDFTVNFADITATVTPGTHLMRVRGEDESTGGDVLDPCDDLAFGRTNDYTADISGTLGIEDESIASSTFVISTLDNKRFDIKFESTFEGLLNLKVYNTAGQELVYYNMQNEGGTYSYPLDMSYMSSGVYLVRIGSLDGKTVITKKIIVK